MADVVMIILMIASLVLQAYGIFRKDEPRPEPKPEAAEEK